MSINVPINSLSQEEKLALFEELWQDIYHEPHDFSSPEWHKSILEERRQQLEIGGESILDWEVAKKAIREQIQ